MGIKLSKKHGLNPAIPKCFYCGEDKNEIILAGRLPDDAEAPHGAVWDTTPCEKCADCMRQGVILIEVRDGESGRNPYRAGGWVVVKEDAIRRMIKEPALSEVLKNRVAFIESAVWKAIGLGA